MKIAIYKDTLANNRGADVAVRNLAAGLSERGHGVTLFEKDELREKALGGYDVMVAAGTNELLDLAEMDALPPIVMQFHTDPAYQFRHWIRKLRRNRAIKNAMRKCAAIQVLRDEHVPFVSRIAPDVPVSVIGNWSEYGATEAAPPAAHFAGETAPTTILYPAAINKDKNQRLLVEAFRLITDDFPEWEVRLYGKGKPNFKPHPRVHFMGFADLARPFAECAFVAFPSKTEGFPLTIADAAAFGKPAVMIHDWIGTCAAGGGIVTAPNIKAFAEGLRTMMSNAAMRLKMGGAARAYCSQRHSRAKILDLWETLLQNVGCGL